MKRIFHYIAEGHPHSLVISAVRKRHCFLLFGSAASVQGFRDYGKQAVIKEHKMLREILPKSAAILFAFHGPKSLGRNEVLH